MRFLINIVIILSIGLSVGGLSAAYLIERTYGIGAINIGPWSAWPFVGGAEIDPYTLARATSDGAIPLGAAEGLAFEALTDSQGNDLRQECDYIITGQTSAARFWTLTAYAKQGEFAFKNENRKSAVSSSETLRFPDGSFEINLSNAPRSKNWLPLKNEGSFRLVFRLYDTPITANVGLVAPEMPSVDKLDCTL